MNGEVGRVIDFPPPAPPRPLPRLSIAGLAALPVALAACSLASGLYDFSKWGLVTAGMLVILVAALLSGTARLGAPGGLIAGALAILLISSAFSLTYADSVDRAWTEMHRVGLYLAVFVVATSLLRSKRHVDVLVPSLALAVALPALVALGSVLAGDETAFVQGRLDAPVNYINGTAGLLLVGIWPCIALAERRNQPVLAGAGLGLGTIELGLLVLTQSRAAVPALLLSCVVLLALVPGRTARIWALLVAGTAAVAGLSATLQVYDPARVLRLEGVDGAAAAAAGWRILLCGIAAGALWTLSCLLARRLPISAGRLAAGVAVTVVLIGSVAAVAAVDDPVDAVSEQYQRFVDNDASATSSTRFLDAGGFRADLWRVAVREFADDPVGGVGAGSYGLRYFQLRSNPESVRQPHNLGLQFMAELGMGGGVAFVLLIAGLGWGLVASRAAGSVTVGCGGLVIAWLVHTSVDWLWNLPAITGLAIVAAAGLTARPDRPDFDPRRYRLPAGLLLVGVALFTASLSRQYVADHYRSSASEALSIDPAKALRKTRLALTLAPASMETYYLRSAAFARFGAYVESRATLLQSTKREPLNFVPWALLGDIAVRRGDFDAAKDAYQRASDLNPLDESLEGYAEDPKTVPTS